MTPASHLSSGAASDRAVRARSDAFDHLLVHLVEDPHEHGETLAAR